MFDGCFIKKIIAFFRGACYTKEKTTYRKLCARGKGGTRSMYSAVELSKYIVTKCISDGQPISNLQLQKILYFVQKTYLNKGMRAFPEEIEAWQFGPVVPESYYRFAGFGAMPISLSYNDVDIALSDKEIVNPIVEAKREMNPWELVEETHKPNGAWSQIYRNGSGNREVIPIRLIKAEG